jgi:hypothetical protein
VTTLSRYRLNGTSCTVSRRSISPSRDTKSVTRIESCRQQAQDDRPQRLCSSFATLADSVCERLSVDMIVVGVDSVTGAVCIIVNFVRLCYEEPLGLTPVRVSAG